MDESALLTRANAKEAPLKRLVKQFFDFQTLLSAAPSPESNGAWKESYDALLRELALYEQSLQRLPAAAAAAALEAEEHEAAQNDAKNNILTFSSQLSDAQNLLASARATRAYEEEYDALARVIAQTPPRSQSTAAAVTLHADVAALTASAKQSSSIVSSRKRQFSLLMHALYELQMDLAEETEALGGASALESRRRPAQSSVDDAPPSKSQKRN